MLTARLHGVLSRHDLDYAAARDRCIVSTVEAFTTAFSIYRNSQRSEFEQARHLADVMHAAADLGVWLFEQPCGFEFVWHNATEGQVVVLPAMVKVCDEQGRQLRVAQRMVDAVTTSL